MFGVGGTVVVAWPIVMMRVSQQGGGQIVVSERAAVRIAAGVVMVRGMRRRLGAVREISRCRAIAAVVVRSVKRCARRLTQADAIVVTCAASRVSQQACRESIGADLEAQRPVGRRHEPRRDQRANDQRNQQRADHPEALCGARNPAHSDET